MQPKVGNFQWRCLGMSSEITPSLVLFYVTIFFP
jgi:hypothetical protein